ncbi:hypothetical protein [Ferrimonas sp. SCSIO 43195]|uniref:hypothetical protein n=1 Tax=Ferrimonas sp. SCSIO 43195 TaxID=2822844 RepID=UPI002075AF53|nr:hypothetical protein [Ferrimonas sp. SCSIO 43195]USD39393.1 hypothetical protein J8Z22_10005 [Ferrimonas sp. SCSIO 43195]
MTKKQKYATLIIYAIVAGFGFDLIDSVPAVASNLEIAAAIYLASFMTILIAISSSLFKLSFKTQFIGFINPVQSENRNASRVPYGIAVGALTLYFSGNLGTMILSTTLFCIGELLCIENQTSALQ